VLGRQGKASGVVVPTNHSFHVIRTYEVSVCAHNLASCYQLCIRVQRLERRSGEASEKKNPFLKPLYLGKFCLPVDHSGPISARYQIPLCFYRYFFLGL
jgi:hypothetical protein